MSLAEYMKRKQKLKPKGHEPEHRAPVPAVAKTHVPVSSKIPVNTLPPPAVKQSTKSGFLDLLLYFQISVICGHLY